MKSVSMAALGLALALGSLAPVQAPAMAQHQGRVFTLTKEERAAILPLQAAMDANNYAAAATVLPDAQAAARSADARYFVANYQLRLGIGTGNLQMQAQAIEAILASGVAPAADLPPLYAAQATHYAGTGDLKKAEAAFTRLVELTPNDAEAVARLAEVKSDLGKNAEAVTLFDRAVSMRQAAGQPVPASWLKRGLNLASAARIAPQSLKFSRTLAAIYPNAQNWRDAVLAYRDFGSLDPEARLDLLRLQRAARALHGERDYQEYATAFNNADLPSEANAALTEGISQKMIDPAKPGFKELVASTSRRAAAAKAAATADALLARADYAKAADLYRAALQGGSVDPNLTNTRLGIALALAGRRTEAEAAFRAVSGPRAELAALWLAWLGQRG